MSENNLHQIEEQSELSDLKSLVADVVNRSMQSKSMREQASEILSVGLIALRDISIRRGAD